jgi:hypothetical protein
MIKGFAHLYLINSWYSIFTDQMRILLTSGLYDACEEINISLIGFPEDRALFEKYFSDIYPKLKIRCVSVDPMDYEFNALRLIENDNSDYVGFYFHTKAVTRPFEPAVNHWRSFLNERILNTWREHYERVMNGYDVSSVNFMKSPDHFSGNFWWFNREYINRCPKIDTLDLKNRFHAEQLIAMGKGKFYYPEFQEPGETAFLMKYK